LKVKATFYLLVETYNSFSNLQTAKSQSCNNPNNKSKRTFYYLSRTPLLLTEIY